MSPTTPAPQRLPLEIFTQVVRHAPLVSMDLIVRDREGRTLLGWRRNRPARDSWFVPGGILLKNERFIAAFARISRAELGVELTLEEARFLGAFEHLYPDNFSGAPDFGTHYVVLAYAVDLDSETLSLPTDQHGKYLWLSDAELATHPDVHPNSRAYAGL